MKISIAGLVRGSIDQLVGLVVDDGFVAVGAVLALALTGWLATNATAVVPTETLGVVLFLVVTLILLTSLARAGLAARSHPVPEQVSEAN